MTDGGANGGSATRRSVLTGLLAASCAPAAAPPTVEGLDGALIEVWVPFREGGGTDAWVRALRPWIEVAVPGENDVIVVNYARAGGIGGANEFAKRAALDGTRLLATSGSIQVPYLLGDRRVRYDYAAWAPIFATPEGGVVYAPGTGEGTTRARALDALMGRRLRFGSQGIATLDLLPLLSFEMLGLHVRPVFGMKSRKDCRFAMMRGELQIDYQTTATYLNSVRPLADAGRATPLFTWGALSADGGVVRDPTFPDLPAFPEVYERVRGAPPSGEAWEAWRAFFVAGFGAQKFLVVPRATAPRIVAAYKDRFADLARDPAFLRAMADQIGAYAPITGPALDQALAEATEVRPQVRAWVLDWLSDRYGYRS